MHKKIVEYLNKELEIIREAGLFKNERIIESEQGAEIVVKGKKYLIFVPTIIWDFHRILS